MKIKNKIVIKVSIICIFVLCLITIPTTSNAVDGYKQFKFGMTAKEIRETGYCSFHSEKQSKNILFLGCFDFPFAGKQVSGGFFIVNGQLLRIAIQPNINKRDYIASKLLEKYGRPSSASTLESFEAVETLPNREAWYAFDRDTVIFKTVSDELRHQHLILMYNSPKYDQELRRQAHESLEGDL